MPIASAFISPDNTLFVLTTTGRLFERLPAREDDKTKQVFLEKRLNINELGHWRYQKRTFIWEEVTFEYEQEEAKA